MNRRNLLKRMGNLSLFSSFLPFIDIASSNAKNAGKVVIVGAGWGGLSAAKSLRLMNKSCKITLLEKKKNFISCPMSNWVIGQIININDITFNYEKFKKNNDIEVIFDEAMSINTNKKIISTNNITLKYDKLILSPGIQLDFSNIDGYTNNSDNSIYSGYSTEPTLTVFNQKAQDDADEAARKAEEARIAAEKAEEDTQLILALVLVSVVGVLMLGATGFAAYIIGKKAGYKKMEEAYKQGSQKPEASVSSGNTA